ACLPPRAYLSPEFFEAELRHAFPRSWVFVANERELAEPGDFVTAEVGTVPLLVVRGEDGVIRALSNVCTHQACLLKNEDGGNTGRSIRCPFHGWAFSLDGQLRNVPRPDGFLGTVDRAQLALREVRLDAWKGLLFVNLSGDAAPLEEWLDAIPEM